MISQTAEYALRAVLFLADRGAECNTQEIAEGTLVPAGYLAKVLQALSRGKIVKSRRGLHGGFFLLRSPNELTVFEIIDAVDPLQRIRTCPLGLKAHGVNLCPMHKRLDDAMATVEHAFRNSTVAEILAEPTASKPLCDFPAAPPSPARSSADSLFEAPPRKRGRRKKR